MNETLLSPDEISAALKELGVQPPEYLSFLELKRELNKVIEKKINSARSKLTYEGQYHNLGNRQTFSDLIAHRFGEGNVSLWTFDGAPYVKLTIKNLGYDLRLNIYDDFIEVSIGYRVNFKLGLHSKFYDELLHFLFDEEGEFHTLSKKYDILIKSIDVYDDACVKANNTTCCKNALKDAVKYEALKSSYEKLRTELSPLSDYVHLNEWTAHIHTYAINLIIYEIKNIIFSINRNPVSLHKQKDKYNKLLSVLEGAAKQGLLTKDEFKFVVPFDDLILNLTGDETALKCSYAESVTNAINQKIQECKKSDTAYMRKKVAGMKADIEMCRQLQSKHGLFCFIDRSHFSGYVDHFNVVDAQDMVWVFRISRNNHSAKDCEKAITLIKLQQDLRESTGTGINLTFVKNTHKRKTLEVNAPGIKDDAAEQYKSLAEDIRCTRLSITGAKVSITFPIGAITASLSLKRKESTEVLIRIKPIILEFQAKYKRGLGFDSAEIFKGSYDKRAPKL